MNLLIKFSSYYFASMKAIINAQTIYLFQSISTFHYVYTVDYVISNIKYYENNWGMLHGLNSYHHLKCVQEISSHFTVSAFQHFLYPTISHTKIIKCTTR